MAIVLDLPRDVQQRLEDTAARNGQDPAEYVIRLLERELQPKEVDLDAFLALSRETQDQLLREAAADAAPLYAADLALPATERELTAFTTLDGEEFADAV